MCSSIRSQDVDPISKENKETRTPAKKNRIQLDPTEEEEDIMPRSRSNSDTPPQSVSPPQEMKMKVRQISQGVEDLSWRNMKAATPERDIEVDPGTTPLAVRGNENGLVSSDATADTIGEISWMGLTLS
jgi:Ran-binding protein 3